MRTLHTAIACVLATICLSVTATAVEDGPSYKVDLEDAINHYVSVTMTAESSGPVTEIMMPTWTPGSYMIREYARNIDRIEATDSRGKALPIVKINKNRWRIETGEAKKFKVTYRVYCNERSVRTNWVGVDYGVLNGAPTFVTVPDQITRPHHVALELPIGWQRSASSLRPDGKLAHRYLAETYHELVDSPIVVGQMEIHPFMVGDVEHFLVNVNPPGDVDYEQATEDLGKIVTQHQNVWGVVPYDRYYFLNVHINGGGGLEHDNSCLMMSTQLDTDENSSYQSWLGLASHEFFHTWNVRRLRPKALVEYDYESEVYTPSLWVAEGVTSYYEDLLVARAGLMTETDMVRKISGQIESVQRTEGRLVQSLRDSSHDAWIKYYRPSPNSRDTQISYYTKGAVVAFLLDCEIRQATGGEKSLDDVLRIMFERYANGVGYLPEDFRQVCNEIAGVDLNPWFARAVDSTEELDYQTAANWLGLAIGDLTPETVAVVSEEASEESDGESAGTNGEDSDAESTDADSDASSSTSAADPANDSADEPEANGNRAGSAEESADAAGGRRPRSGRFRGRSSSQDSDKPRRWLGIGEPDSPATKVGLADTDEILAVNGVRLEGSIDSRLQDFEVGDPLKILVSRDGQIREFLVAVGELQPPPSWSVRIASESTEQHAERRTQWVGSK